jgi:anti-sigma factor RsiW
VFTVTCQEFVAFLLDYVSGELSPEVRASFEEHIGECDDCRHFLASYRTTIDVSRLACGAGPHTPAGAVAPEELVQAILQAVKRG